MSDEFRGELLQETLEEFLRFFPAIHRIFKNFLQFCFKNFSTIPLRISLYLSRNSSNYFHANYLKYFSGLSFRNSLSNFFSKFSGRSIWNSSKIFDSLEIPLENSNFSLVFFTNSSRNNTYKNAMVFVKKTLPKKFLTQFLKKSESYD